MAMYDPPHPGLLIADILENAELKIPRTITALAKHLGVTRPALSRVVNGKAAVSADMAMRLQDSFGVDADVWLGMQAARDLWLASRVRRKRVASLVLKRAA